MSATRVPNTGGMSSCIAGLFHSDSSAENAMARLKEAGFPASEISVATAGETHGHGAFWDKIGGLFGKQERPEPASELEGSLQACGIPQQQATYFNHSLEEGDVLVIVRTSGGKAITAQKILENAGADIGTNTARAAEVGTRAPVQGERRIELLGEILRVHKERVQRGEVRLRKEVVTETQHVEVPVTREELIIERTPVQGREATGQVGTGEKEIRVPLSEEQVRVEKKPVVTEEVRVGKKQVQDTKRVEDNVRHEELRSEREGNVEVPEDVREKRKRTA